MLYIHFLLIINAHCEDFLQKPAHSVEKHNKQHLSVLK